MEYGKIIKNKRMELGLSQKELGHSIGVSQQLIGAWEKDRRRISLYDADKLFRALGVSVSIGAEEVHDDTERNT